MCKKSQNIAHSPQLTAHFYLFFALCSLLIAHSSQLTAQVYGAGSSVYSFMNLPYSARLNALGGDNVAIQDGELSMALMNPALLCSATDKVLQLNYAYYFEGTMFGSALYGHNFGRSKIENPSPTGEPDKPNYFAAGIHYLNYGKMAYADEYGNLTGGMFMAQDVLIDLMYARQLGPLFTVGVSLKPIYSVYESYTAFALGADVGGHFQTKDSTFHLGLTLRNVGWQLKSFYSREGGGTHESLPLNLEIGFSYRFRHAPIRLSMTAHNLQRWDLTYNLSQQTLADTKPVTWYDMLFRHTVFALDIVPKKDNFYLTISYNHRRRAEMHLADQRSLAGFAFGAGVRIKQVRVGFAMSQYTKSVFTYQASLSMDINRMMK